MTITFNNQKLEITLENEKTLGDLFTNLQKNLEQDKATITGICIDNQPVNVNDFDNIFKKNINDVKDISVYGIFEQDISTHMISLGEEFSKIVDDLENLSTMIQSGNTNNVNHSINRFADLLTDFFDTIKLFTLFPEKFANIKIGEQSIQDFVQEFKPILDDFLVAFQEQDIVMISDLSEYEIAPRTRNIIEMSKSITI